RALGLQSIPPEGHGSCVAEAVARARNRAHARVESVLWKNRRRVVALPRGISVNLLLGKVFRFHPTRKPSKSLGLTLVIDESNFPRCRHPILPSPSAIRRSPLARLGERRLISE